MDARTALDKALEAGRITVSRHAYMVALLGGKS